MIDARENEIGRLKEDLAKYSEDKSGKSEAFEHLSNSYMKAADENKVLSEKYNAIRN